MPHFRFTHRRRTILALLPVLIAALVAGAASGQAEPTARAGKLSPAVPGELIVGFRPSVTRARQDELLGRVGAEPERRLAGTRAAVVSVKADGVREAIRRLTRDPRVAFAEPNFVVSVDSHGATPNDPSFHQLWGLDNFGQTVNWAAGTPDADVDAREAWAVSTGSPDVVVAVIDTGVDLSHPDLAANIWTNPGESCAGCRTNGVDDDANGYVDDWRGWDFANDDNDPGDDHGHGTHVAGTIAAVGDNGIGVAGVTWSTKIMPLKFLSAAGSGTVADAIDAILYASAQGVPILNNSWGGDAFSQALLAAIEQADASDALFVAAAGNSFMSTDVTPTYPSGYDVANVVSVGASDSFDRRSWFSNYGVKSVDLSAPGSGILSTWPGASYRFLDGTSMAAPHVSGATALAAAAHTGTSAAGLKALLMRSVDPIAALATASRTSGRLNVDRAVRCAGQPQAWIDAPAAGFDVDAGEALAIRVLAANCGAPAGVTLTATANGEPIALTARGDGVHSATVTPAPGPLSVSVTAGAGGATDVQTVSGMATRTYEIAAGGTPVTITTNSADENARLHFEGSAGQRVSLRLSSVMIGSSACCSTRVSIARPEGTALVAATPIGTNGGFVDTRTLPTSGEYTILVDPQGADTGSMTLTLYDVPPDHIDAIAPDGQAMRVGTTTPGQNARLTFDGVAGGRISLRVSEVSIGTSICCSARVSILKPGGSTLVFPAPFGRSGTFVDTRTLTETGAYTVLVDPQGADVGSATLTLYAVPPDVTASTAPGGSPVTVSMGPVPGQNALVGFSGTAGRRISLTMSDVTIGSSACCSARVSITKPDGSTLVFATPVGRSGGFLDTRSLPLSGQHTILVDPQGVDLGSMTLALHDVPPDVSGTIAVGGPPVSLSLGPVPGQNAMLRFSGTAGQRISLRLSNVTIGSSLCCGANISIAKPDGMYLVPPGLVGTSGRTITTTLPASGTYAIGIDPRAASTGDITLTLSLS